jgi:hypothetical protein
MLEGYVRDNALYPNVRILCTFISWMEIMYHIFTQCWEENIALGNIVFSH